MTVRNAVRAAATIVSVATFVLLYFGLVDLARTAGIHDARAWLYPLAIDGMVAAGYASTLVLRGRHLAFAWAVVGIGSAMSLVGQWLHAEASSDWSYAGPVAAAPAVSMSLVWHLLWLVSVRDEETVEAPAPVAPVARPVAPVAPVVASETVRPRTVPAAVSAPVSRVAKPSDTESRAVSILRAARAAGETLTGAEMAVRLRLDNAGTASGRRTGLRWLRRAEEVLA